MPLARLTPRCSWRAAPRPQCSTPNARPRPVEKRRIAVVGSPLGTSNFVPIRTRFPPPGFCRDDQSMQRSMRLLPKQRLKSREGSDVGRSV